MKNLASAYRPKTLGDMVGQETVVQTLSNAMQKNNLHPAYLFVGMFGSGKTTAARLLAAMENCVTSPGLYPCGKCDICKQIFMGKHTDVLEIDAASSAGKVEQVRELKKEALFHPVDARTKYFIVDECLPYYSVITVNGQKRLIGEIVEEGLNGDCDYQVAGRNMSDGDIVNRKICRYIKIPNDKQMYEIEIKDENGNLHTVRITGNHSVFVDDGEPVKIKTEDLQIGQKVFLKK